MEFFPQTKSVQHNSPFFFRMQIVAVGAKDSLAGWTGPSFALPKVAADDIPVLPEGAFRPLFNRMPRRVQGRAESPCPYPQVWLSFVRTRRCTHTRRYGSSAFAPTGAKTKKHIYITKKGSPEGENPFGPSLSGLNGFTVPIPRLPERPAR